MRTLVKIALFIAATALAACVTEDAFRVPPTGAPCEDFGGHYIPGDDPTAREYVFCDRGHVTRIISYDEELREGDLCDGLEVRGDGLCIDVCFTRTPPAVNSVERVCLVEDTPAHSQAPAPWDETTNGCDALFAGSPENGQPCVGTGWGCAGVLTQPGQPPGFGWNGAIWCDEGTLRVVLVPSIHLDEPIFRN